jgi:hypothetical protein
MRATQVRRKNPDFITRHQVSLAFPHKSEPGLHGLQLVISILTFESDTIAAL